MAVQITIRDVPDAVRDELAARAALEGKSMQEFLREELGRLAAKPSMARWVAEVRERKRLNPKNVPVSVIVEARRSDRR